MTKFKSRSWKWVAREEEWSWAHEARTPHENWGHSGWGKTWVEGTENRSGLYGNCKTMSTLVFKALQWMWECRGPPFRGPLKRSSVKWTGRLWSLCSFRLAWIWAFRGQVLGLRFLENRLSGAWRCSRNERSMRWLLPVGGSGRPSFSWIWMVTLLPTLYLSYQHTAMEGKEQILKYWENKCYSSCCRTHFESYSTDLPF